DIEHSQVHTVDGGAVNGVHALAHLMDSERFVQSDRMCHRSSFSIRRNNPHFSQSCHRLGEHDQAWGKNPIIVCDENAQMFVRHKKSCTWQLPSLPVLD